MTRIDAGDRPVAPEGRLAQSIRVTEQVWPAGTVPLVSICCITYNHGPFIRQCLDGFLMQETTFPVEVLIHDDASSDGTADVVREYAARYPELIRPILQTENQYSKGKGFKPNLLFNYPRVQGDYIALCEGDDCWTATCKLQAQVSFLEENLGFSACFHDVVKSVPGGGPPEGARYVGDGVKAEVTLRDVVRVNFIPTAAIVFRAETVRALPSWYRTMPVGDWPLHVLNAQRGPMHYLNQVWGVYRVHTGGIWSSLPRVAQLRKNIVLAETFNRHLRFEHADVLGPRLAEWNFELAQSLGDTGPRREVLRCLLATHRYRHPKVPSAEVKRLILRCAWPWLFDRVYWRWQRATRGLHRNRH